VEHRVFESLGEGLLEEVDDFFGGDEFGGGFRSDGKALGFDLLRLLGGFGGGLGFRAAGVEDTVLVVTVTVTVFWCANSHYLLCWWWRGLKVRWCWGEVLGDELEVGENWNFGCSSLIVTCR
jgi:hypothetical protein